LSVMLALPARALALLQAIGDGKFNANDLSSTQSELLLKHRDARISALASKILAANRPAPRSEVIAAFHDALTLKGDAARGRSIYIERCSPCHRADGQGYELGPDLITVKAAG